MVSSLMNLLTELNDSQLMSNIIKTRSRCEHLLADEDHCEIDQLLSSAAVRIVVIEHVL